MQVAQIENPAFPFSSTFATDKIGYTLSGWFIARLANDTGGYHIVDVRVVKWSDRFGGGVGYHMINFTNRERRVMTKEEAKKLLTAVKEVGTGEIIYSENQEYINEYWINAEKEM